MYALTAECTHWLPNVRIDCRMYLVVYILLMYALLQNVCIDCRMYLAHVRPFCWMYLWDVLLYFIRPVFAKHWIYPLFGIAVSLIYLRGVCRISKISAKFSPDFCANFAWSRRWTRAFSCIRTHTDLERTCDKILRLVQQRWPSDYESLNAAKVIVWYSTIFSVL